MMIMMPFMFVSGAFAPLDTMPGWMQAAATLNPVAHATDALRGHVLGTASFGDTATALLAASLLWLTVAGAAKLGRRRGLYSAGN
jgi:ABC-2 type transport system permease protein